MTLPTALAAPHFSPRTFLPALFSGMRIGVHPAYDERVKLWGDGIEQPGRGIGRDRCVRAERRVFHGQPESASLLNRGTHPRPLPEEGYGIHTSSACVGSVMCDSSAVTFRILGDVMDEFAGAFGDSRRAEAVSRLYGSIVDQSSLVVRKVGVDRAGEMSAHRALSSPRVTPEETLGCLARATASAAAGRRIVVAQDTTEVSFAGRQSRGLGPAGLRDVRRGDPAPGFYIHAAVAVDADADAVLGLAHAEIWTRDLSPPLARRERALSDKESQRWLSAAQTVSERLSAAAQVIVVGDRESDIYALFSRRPARAELLVRSGQNRALDDGSRLFDAASDWPVLGLRDVQVPPRGPGDRGRVARVALKAGTVVLKRPRNGRRGEDPASLDVTLVEAVEVDAPAGTAPLHWRLLTTLQATQESAAAEVVRLYRLRWRIEQSFRMLKTHGLQIEDVQTAEPHRLFNLAALATGAAVRIIQLVDARDGSERPATDVATGRQIAAAAALCRKLEGKTDRQRNRHPNGSLAWLSWIIARLGGWNCYYKPPGPKTMRDGWNRFAAIAEGYALANSNGRDV